MMVEPAARSLIVGCGYVGRRLAARLVADGQVVYGTTRTQGRARELAGYGVRPLLLQVTQPVTYASLRPALEGGESEDQGVDVYYLVPPGRVDQHPSPRQTVLGGIGHMVKALKRAQVRRAVLVSSSAVYGHQGGQRVDADTPALPASERAELLAEGERLWLAGGEGRHVLRLAGIYGPGRVIGLRAVAEGAPLVGDPQALLNLIHVDDAVELLLAMMRADSPGRVELGCDGQPVARQAYYAHLADWMGVDRPRVLSDDEAAEQLGLDHRRLRNASSKALDNAVTCARTGWRPKYASYQEGLEVVLREHAQRRGRGR